MLLIGKSVLCILDLSVVISALVCLKFFSCFPKFLLHLCCFVKQHHHLNSFPKLAYYTQIAIFPLLSILSPRHCTNLFLFNCSRAISFIKNIDITLIIGFLVVTTYLRLSMKLLLKMQIWLYYSLTLNSLALELVPSWRNTKLTCQNDHII